MIYYYSMIKIENKDNSVGLNGCWVFQGGVTGEGVDGGGVANTGCPKKLGLVIVIILEPKIVL